MNLPDDFAPTIGELNHLIIPSKVAYAGMPIREALEECVTRQLPGIPFCDAEDRIIGRVSIKNLLVQNCIPADVSKHADLLGDVLSHLTIARTRVSHILALPVDPFVIPQIPSVSLASPLYKALALIDKYRSSYIFVVENGKYQGTITLMHIIEVMLKL